MKMALFGLERPGKRYNGIQLVGAMFRTFLNCENHVTESDCIFWAWKYLRCTDHLKTISRIFYFVQPGRVGLKCFKAKFSVWSGQ